MALPRLINGQRRLPAFTAIAAATALLFVVSWIVQPASLSQSAIQGMLPFAAILVLAALGQTLVIQQGGIDLSVPGVISLTVVIMTHYPDGDGGLLPSAVLLAFGAALAAGLLSGFIVSKVGITAIVTTLGMNAVLFGANFEISDGTANRTTADLQSFTSSQVLGIDTPIVIAIVITAIVAFVVKRTVIGRRFEAVGANPAAARAAGVEPGRYQIGAYVGANLLYACAGILLAGVISTPSATQGDTYLLPSVAAVVLGGTSLLGGVGSPVATAVGALFLSQLDQFVLTTGASSGVQFLVQAGALAIGIGVYSLSWRQVRERIRGIRTRQTGGPLGPLRTREGE